MHSTWHCITHSCYITLARKFKTSGLGWKGGFNFLMDNNNTRDRGKKRPQKSLFLVVLCCSGFKTRPSLPFQTLCPQLSPSLLMVQQPGNPGHGLSVRARLGLRSPDSPASSHGPFGRAVPFSSKGVHSSWPPLQCSGASSSSQPCCRVMLVPVLKCFLDQSKHMPPAAP